MTTDCPHPTKKRHASKHAALLHIASMDKAGTADLSLHPYLCRCGAWHVGHTPRGPIKVQLRRALTEGRRATELQRRPRRR